MAGISADRFASEVLAAYERPLLGSGYVTKAAYDLAVGVREAVAIGVPAFGDGSSYGRLRIGLLSASTTASPALTRHVYPARVTVRPPSPARGASGRWVLDPSGRVYSQPGARLGHGTGSGSRSRRRGLRSSAGRARGPARPLQSLATTSRRPQSPPTSTRSAAEPAPDEIPDRLSG